MAHLEYGEVRPENAVSLVHVKVRNEANSRHSNLFMRTLPVYSGRVETQIDGNTVGVEAPPHMPLMALLSSREVGFSRSTLEREFSDRLGQ